MKYQVKVDGKVYEVEIEKVGGPKPLSMADFGPAPAPAPQAAPQPAPAPQAAPQPAPAPQAAPQPAPQAAPQPAPAASSGGGEQVTSPMPGNILRVVVNEGDQVTAGDVILILEAMKMENEIVAPVDGKVALKVRAGETVDTDQLLAEIN